MSVAVRRESVSVLKMCVGFELGVRQQPTEHTRVRRLCGRRSRRELAEAFDLELEELPAAREFWVGPKNWRAVWDDFRNWLIQAS